MDKNYKQKVKDFFRKEGFYIVLFVCLGLIITAAIISFNLSNKERNITSEVNEIDDTSENSNGVMNEIPNAERVENEKNTSEEKNKEENKEESKVVSKMESEVKFINPVEGKLLRGYTYPKPVKIDENNQRTIRGIDIEAKIGTEVKAAAEGVVESVGDRGVEEGISIVIVHTNGLKTKYCNLASEVKVNKGDRVNAGTVIGKIGETAKIFDTKTFGEHLNLQVLDSKDAQLDPLKYFNYKNK